MTKDTASKVKCALCDKAMVQAYKPFCSKRCADVDLNRWLGENYRIPTEESGVANDPYGEDYSEY